MAIFHDVYPIEDKVQYSIKIGGGSSVSDGVLVISGFELKVLVEMITKSAYKKMESGSIGDEWPR